ncbi:MAG: hypothetical protein DME30_03695 [Verrucomicrobia bacterium]|nr:MAG: hypothetical protein DME30_03695 [Verrucomicrobiota bacterium]
MRDSLVVIQVEHEDRMTRFGDRRMMTQVSPQSLETAAARTPPFFSLMKHNSACSSNSRLSILAVCRMLVRRWIASLESKPNMAA